MAVSEDCSASTCRVFLTLLTLSCEVECLETSWTGPDQASPRDTGTWRARCTCGTVPLVSSTARGVSTRGPRQGLNPSVILVQVSSSDAVADALVRSAPQFARPGYSPPKDGDEAGDHQAKRDDADERPRPSPSDVHRVSEGSTRGVRPNRGTQQHGPGDLLPPLHAREAHLGNGAHGAEGHGVREDDGVCGERQGIEVCDEGARRGETAAREELDSGGRHASSAGEGRAGGAHRVLGAVGSVGGSDGGGVELESDSRRRKAGLTLGSSSVTLPRFGSDSLEDPLPVVPGGETPGHGDQQPGIAARGKGDEDDDGTGGRPLALLWPPPRACTLVPHEVCRVPEQVLVRKASSPTNRV